MSTFKQILDKRFGGNIAAGCHREEDMRACALELMSVKKGIVFTDSPVFVGCFDFRAINDMHVPDKLRTEWMLRMLETYEDSLDWDMARQKKVIERIIISTVNQLLADVPGLNEKVANRCRTAKTLKKAITAAGDAILCSTDDDHDTATYIIRANDMLLYSSLAEHHLRTAARCIAASVAAAAYTAYVCHKQPEDVVANIFTKACKLWLEAAKD